MLCDVVVKNAPPSVSDYEEAVQDAESERWYGEEIHGGDGFTVIAQEGRPMSCRLWIVRSLPHPAQNRALRNLKPEHVQLTMDPRRTPGAIFGYHAEDQLSNVRARGLPPNGGMF